MQYTLAVKGMLSSLEQWQPQPTVRQDESSTLGSLRRVAFRLASHEVMEGCWYAAVVLSTLLCLAVQPAYDMGTITYAVLFAIQVVLLAFFWFRMLLHMVGCGLFAHPHAVLRSFWNWVELVVNVFGILQLIPPTNDITWMRAVSAARPLRLLFVQSPFSRMLLVPAARFAPSLLDVGFALVLGWICLSAIGTLVLGDRLNSRCYITQVLQNESVYDNASLPTVLLNSGESVLCGVGRACVSPLPHIMKVDCLPRAPPPVESPGAGDSGDAQGMTTFFTYRNLGTSLLVTLQVGSLDAVQEELERWMILRGSGAALFPVGVILLMTLGGAALMATYARADSVRRRHRFADTTAGGESGWIANSVTSAFSEEPPPSHASTQHMRPLRPSLMVGSSTHATGGGATAVSVGTQASARPGALSLTINDDLNWSPGEPASFMTHTQNGNPFSPDEDGGYGPFVLSSLEKQPRRNGTCAVHSSFFDTWQRRGLWAAMQRQMQTLPTTTTRRMRCIRSILESPWLAAVHIFFLVANVVLLAVNSSVSSITSKRILAQTSAAVSLLLLPHAFASLLAFQPLQFPFYVWQFVKLCGGVTGILELAVPFIFDFYVVRGLRIFRVLALIQFTSSFALLQNISAPLLHLAAAFITMLGLYALVGMQLFSEGHLLASQLRANFRTMWHALLSVFIAATGDGWSTAMLTACRMGRVAPAVLFYLSLLFWSFFLSRVLLVSVIANAFHKRHIAEWLAFSSGHNIVPPLLLAPPMTINTVDSGSAETTEDVCCDVHDAAWKPPFTNPLEQLRGSSRLDDVGIAIGTYEKQGNMILSQQPGQGSTWARLMGPPRRVFGAALASNAFYMVPPHAEVRSTLARLFHSVIYHVFVFLAVTMGLVAVFFETHSSHAQTSRRKRALSIINIVYVAVFWLEMVLKCVAYGALFAEPFPASLHEVSSNESLAVGQLPPFFRQSLSWLDLAANALTMGGIFYAPLRIGRLLRTARLVTSAERPNRTFLAALGSLVSCLRLVPLAVILYVCFALLGVQFFAERLNSCRGSPEITSRAECVAAQHQWSAPRFSYDHFGHALLSVMALSLTHHWSDFMEAGMGVGDPATAPEGTRAGYYVIFFCAVIVVIRICFHGLVMGYLAAQYSLRRRPAHAAVATSVAAASGSAAKGQQRTSSSWLTLQLTPGREGLHSGSQHCGWLGSEFVALLAPDRCEPMANAVSRACHFIVTFGYPTTTASPSASPKLRYTRSVFEWACLALTFVSCSFVAASYIAPTHRIETVFFAFDCIGVVALGVEVLVRLGAYGLSHLRRAWYVVDIVVLALFVVGMCVPSLTFFRAFLLARLIRMTGLSMSLYPLTRCTWALVNAFFVYAMVLCIFSVVATLVFGDLALDGTTLTEKQNFRTVIGSCLLLFTCSTSGNWAALVRACAPEENTHCGAGRGRCGAAYQSVVFFVVFGALVNTFVVPLCLVSLLDTSAVSSCGQCSHVFYTLQSRWRGLTRCGDLSRVPLMRCFPLVRQSVDTIEAERRRDRLCGRRSSRHDMATLSDEALLAQLRLTTDNRERLSYTQLAVALLQLRCGMLKSDLSWFALRGAAPISASSEEVAAKTLSRARERLQHSCDDAADPEQKEGESLLWQRPRHSRLITEFPQQALNKLDGDHALPSSVARLRAPAMTIPKKTQPVPHSNLVLFNMD